MIETSYDWTLVGLSYLISVFGSFTALRLAIRVPTVRPNQVLPWLLAAATALGGGGIWSMHFIAMLAYKMPINVTYDFGLTALSLVIAVLVTGLGLLMVGRMGIKPVTLGCGALLTGTGVAAMHYTGMAAMQMAADIDYNRSIVALSVLIAVVASAAALWLAFSLRGNLQRFGSALVMGVAVCGMHYTGMAAVTMVPNLSKSVATAGIANSDLALYIFVSTAILLGGGLLLSTRKVEGPDLVFDL